MLRTQSMCPRHSCTPNIFPMTPAHPRTAGPPTGRRPNNSQRNDVASESPGSKSGWAAMGCAGKFTLIFLNSFELHCHWDFADQRTCVKHFSVIHRLALFLAMLLKHVHIDLCLAFKMQPWWELDFPLVTQQQRGLWPSPLLSFGPRQPWLLISSRSLAGRTFNDHPPGPLMLNP